MNYINFYSILILLVSTIPANSQIIRIELISEKGEKLEYANFYAPDSKFGTVSNAEGIIEINMDKISNSERFQISYIGYKDKYLTKSDLDSTHNIIVLEPQIHLIDDIEILAERVKFKNKNIGIKPKLDLCQVGFFSDVKEPGKEIGVLINNKKIGFIENINFSLAYVSHDLIKYELNIYDIKGDSLHQINTERILLNVRKDDDKHVINVRDQNIKVKGNFLVSFEMIEVKNNAQGIFFKSPCFSKHTLMVKTEYGVWEKKKDTAPAVWCRMNYPK